MACHRCRWHGGPTFSARLLSLGHGEAFRAVARIPEEHWQKSKRVVVQAQSGRTRGEWEGPQFERVMATRTAAKRPGSNPGYPAIGCAAFPSLAVMVLRRALNLWAVSPRMHEQECHAVP